MHGNMRLKAVGNTTVTEMGDITPRGARRILSFMDKVAATEDQFMNLFNNCRKQISESGKKQGALITCCAVYTFSKDIKDISSVEANDYGMGKLERARLGTGEEILPLPGWMESGVGLRANFGEKVGTKRKHSSGDASKKGFEVPWTAHIRLESIPLGCILESVQLSFINPDAAGSPVVKIDVPAQDACNLYLINDKLMNIKGQTYSECCRGLGIFRQAFCYITLRVPLRLLIREQLKHLRNGFPVAPANAVQKDYSGHDNVTLECGESSITVERDVLTNISKEAKSFFGPRTYGSMSVCSMGVSKEVVLAVLGVRDARTDYYPLDPYKITLDFLYELLTLSTDWGVRSKRWTQLAFLECLCAPGLDLQQVPVLAAVECLKKDYEIAKNEVGAKMVALGYAMVLRDIMMSADRVLGPTRFHLERSVAAILTDTELTEPSKNLENEQQDITVTIVTLTGTRTVLEVTTGDTVENLKAAFQMRAGMPVDQQGLIFGGQQLENWQTLSDCDISHGAVIHCIMNLRGC
ncbi:uncharacterized protein LOC129595904 [Paramacrobiotus metropolitanus]|uniref:uncharacterized protein LOC129595904 n=1 Tax=Paramacrobiotus metropolitanus TaxID=2943436 RepID=UPI0024463078|nr:uncharacterized protein LOC129595904 [Paramacrobiotus metropolitanus]